MDSQYLAYFTQRIEELTLEEPVFQRPAFEPAARAWQRDAHALANVAIEAARQELPERYELRPDAQLLIYLLTSEFVARPVLAAQPEAASDLAADVAADAATVVRAAVLDTDESEVSAHRLIDALSRSWQELRTAKWRVWDRYAE